MLCLHQAGKQRGSQSCSERHLLYPSELHGVDTRHGDRRERPPTQGHIDDNWSSKGAGRSGGGDPGRDHAANDRERLEKAYEHNLNEKQ